MTLHRIIKDFLGSQDGINTTRFREGESEHLSDDLAAIAVREGWAEAEEGNPAENRETKVIIPEERKPLKFNRKK